jgi:hypothetical protein
VPLQQLQAQKLLAHAARKLKRRGWFSPNQSFNPANPSRLQTWRLLQWVQQSRRGFSRLVDLIARVNKSGNTAFLFSTHNEDIAAQCTSRIGIRDGQIS